MHIQPSYIALHVHKCGHRGALGKTGGLSKANKCDQPMAREERPYLEGSSGSFILHNPADCLQRPCVSGDWVMTEVLQLQPDLRSIKQKS